MAPTTTRVATSRATKKAAPPPLDAEVDEAVLEPELDSNLDTIEAEPIAPKKSEQARRVVAAYCEDIIQCRDLLSMLGLSPNHSDK